MENNRSRAGRKTENRARPQMGPAPLAVWAAGAGAVLQLVVLRQIGQGGDVLFASHGLVFGVLFLAAAFPVPNGVAGAARARMKKGKTGEASRLFSVSLILALAVGAILAALLFFGGGWIAGRAGGRESAAVWRALALAALFAAGSGAVRGYFYGMGVSAPGVISILLEAAGGGAAALWLAAAGQAQGERSALVYGTDLYRNVFGAEGAVLGLGAGAALSFGFLLLALMVCRREMFSPGGRKKSPAALGLEISAAALPGIVTVLAFGGCFLSGAFRLAGEDGAAWAGIGRSRLAVWAVSSAVCALGVGRASYLPRARRSMRTCLTSAAVRTAAAGAVGGLVLALAWRPLSAFLFPGTEAPSLGAAVLNGVTVLFLSLAAVTAAALFSLGKRWVAAAAALVALAVSLVLSRLLPAALPDSVLRLTAAQAAGPACFCLLTGAALALMAGGGGSRTEKNSRPEPVRGRSRRR